MLIVEGKIDLALSSGCLGTETYMRAYQLQVQYTGDQREVDREMALPDLFTAHLQVVVNYKCTNNLYHMYSTIRKH